MDPAVLLHLPEPIELASGEMSQDFIRKEPKGRGTNLWFEGARISSGTRVMLVDDVVTKGGSSAMPTSG